MRLNSLVLIKLIQEVSLSWPLLLLECLRFLDDDSFLLFLVSASPSNVSPSICNIDGKSVAFCGKGKNNH